MNKKISMFEYFVLRLVQRYSGSSMDNNDLSILKLMKLLFFVTSYSVEVAETSKNINQDNKNEDLLNLFNNFVAMPYGHVEIDVYNYLRNNFYRIGQIEINRFGTNIEFEENENIDTHIDSLKNSINDEESLFYIKLMDDTIEYLDNKNPKLFKDTSTNLVNLSHRYYSWKYYHNLNNTKNNEIPINILRRENRYIKL